MKLTPYRLVTLLEILEHKAEAFWRLSSMIGQLFVRLETGIPLLDVIASTLGELRIEAQRLGIRSAVLQIERINGLVQSDHWGNNLQTLAGLMRPMVIDLHVRVMDDLGDRFFLSIPPENVRYYSQPEPLFGKEVDYQFPNASGEISEAGKCHALNRNTAYVFHLMRTLEVGIEAVRKCLGIPDPIKEAERSWGTVLRKLKDEFSRRNAAAPPLWARPSDRDFFEEVYVSLDAVRNVWRNATMHVEKKYTTEDAEHIFGAVRGFMKKLASRMDERGQPMA